MEQGLKIEYIKVSDLKYYDRNSKIHTSEQIRHIANSIHRFGFNDPIGVAGDENTILEGNGRVEAAKLLGYKSLPCVRLDHLSDEERNAYVIAHNAVSLETGFDDGALYSELKKLQEFDFSQFGIDVDKYLKTFVRVQKRILKDMRYVHYLVSLPVSQHDRIVEQLDKIRHIEGIEIESTTN